MAVVAVAMVKDEADVIRPVVEHLLGQVDEVIVADNGSTDGTRDVLADLPVVLIDDPDPAYYQSAKMTRLAHLAGERGATWVVPFDADEVWYTPHSARIGDVLTGLPSEILVATADLYDHVTSSLDDPTDPNPLTRIGWRRRTPVPLRKVAVRYRDDLVVEQGNHGATYRIVPPAVPGLLVVRHFPWRSAAQFVRKARNGAAAYAATDLPETTGAHWRAYGRILDEHGEDALVGVYREWFHLDDPARLDDVIYDPAPLTVGAAP